MDLNHNLNLRQGINFLNELEDYYDTIGRRRLSLITETTMKGLGNLEESYTTMRNNALEIKNEIELSRIKDLETQFNQKLAAYINAYTEYMNTVVKEDLIINKYKNQNVMDSNGDYYYVNKYGIARKYSPEAWQNRDASCPKNVPTMPNKELMAKIKIGTSIPLGQPCNLEGTNIRNEKTGAIDWVTPEGIRHHIPDPTTFETLQKKGGCPSTYTNVSQTVYNSFQDGGNYNETSSCSSSLLSSNMVTNSGLWGSIIGLNQDLMDIAQEMYNEVNKLNSSEKKLEGEIRDMRAKLLTEINNLNNERDRLEKARQGINSLSAEYEDNKLRLNVGYLKYMTWMLLAMGVGVYAVNHIFKK